MRHTGILVKYERERGYIYTCMRMGARALHVPTCVVWVRGCERAVCSPVCVRNILNSGKPPNRLRQTCGQTRYASNAKDLSAF